MEISLSRPPKMIQKRIFSSKMTNVVPIFDAYGIPLLDEFGDQVVVSDCEFLEREKFPILRTKIPPLDQEVSEYFKSQKEHKNLIIEIMEHMSLLGYEMDFRYSTYGYSIFGKIICKDGKPLIFTPHMVNFLSYRTNKNILFPIVKFVFHEILEGSAKDKEITYELIESLI